jgi:hypothetical protein
MLILTVLGALFSGVAVLPLIGVDIRIFGRSAMPAEVSASSLPVKKGKRVWLALGFTSLSLFLSAFAAYHFFRPRIVEKIVEKPVDRIVEKIVPGECPKETKPTVSPKTSKSLAPNKPPSPTAGSTGVTIGSGAHIEANSTGDNSPAVGVNSGLISVISGDAELIHSFSILLTLDVPTKPTKVSNEGSLRSLGGGCGVAMWDSAHRRYGMVSDGSYGDTQISEAIHRLTFDLTPAAEDDLTGQKVSALSLISQIGVDCSSILHRVEGEYPNSLVNTSMEVRVNGIKIGNIPGTAQLSDLLAASLSKPGVAEVGAFFAQLPATYARKLPLQGSPKQP